LLFFQTEFPKVHLVELAGYNVRLDSQKNTYWQMLNQAFKINGAIQKENEWLKQYIESNSVDFIISDNRYGFYHEDIPSIIITHQLNLQVPYFKSTANRVIKKKVEKFTTCWLPDTDDRRLSGELSNVSLELPVCFIGPLNRFEAVKAKITYDYLIILSGPEPERSNFLNASVAVMKKKMARAAFVGAEVAGFDSFKDLSTKELQKLIAQSDCVYSRAGYTTIMEMVSLNKKALLIPTIGQYEQQYLSSYIKHDTVKFIELLK
ncbi:MAG: hypothetical protein MI810_10235, partial [Flavobacteriales bacterium]|nr:hypothetical protein [Flavobacteriales bacterium]